MYNEDDLIPISALQHVLYCERQYALIHIEQQWNENQYTMEGQILHDRVDIKHHESRKLKKVEYSLSIRSLNLGLIGISDLVEIEFDKSHNYKSIIPVEFKRGRNKEEDWDRVQLCAQAMCLEEMFEIALSVGQFYYLQEHRRTTITFDQSLRDKTINAITRIRELYESKITPPAVYKPKRCDNCSLQDICMPRILSKRKPSVEQYIADHITMSEY